MLSLNFKKANKKFAIYCLTNIELYLSYEDVQALNRLKSRWNLYGKPDPNGEAIRRAIGERHSIEELTLSKTERHNNRGTVWLEKDVRKALLKEANKLGLNPAEYIRGIIYSLNQKFAYEVKTERVRRAKIKHDNRLLSFRTYVQPELREVLYKKYGKLSDKELMKAVEKDTVEWLSTLK